MWITNETDYLKAISSAMKNEVAFKLIKRNPSFHRAVGVTESMYAAFALNTIGERDLEKFKLNDSIVIPIEKARGIGTDTIRFIETAIRLEDEFGDLTGKSICEYGSNYGGLYLVISTIWPGITEYSLVDLPEVMDFSFYYLTKHGLPCNNISLGKPNKEFDLFIAEYSLTEQTPDTLHDIWKEYEPFIKIGGLIRCNIPEKDREIKFIDLVRENFEVTIIDEPLYRRPNKILIIKR